MLFNLKRPWIWQVSDLRTEAAVIQLKSEYIEIYRVINISLSFLNHLPSQLVWVFPLKEQEVPSGHDWKSGRHLRANHQ